MFNFWIMKNKSLLKNLPVSASINQPLLLKGKSIALTRAGKPYLSITLGDQSGDIDGKIWEQADQLDKQIASGDIVQVKGVIIDYQGTRQIKIEQIFNLSPDQQEQYQVINFLPQSPIPVETMWKEMRQLLGNITNPFVKSVIHQFLEDSEFCQAFKHSPASKKIQHNFIGGLRFHTLHVVKLAHQISQLYPQLNGDLLIAGSFLHDMGKIFEISIDMGFEYTDQGKLLGHLYLGAELFQEKVSGITNFPEELKTIFLHIILSHHGKYEYGSPKLPSITEAQVIYFLDEIDAKVTNITGILSEQSTQASNWSNFSKIHGRTFYRSNTKSWQGTPEIIDRNLRKSKIKKTRKKSTKKCETKNLSMYEE